MSRRARRYLMLLTAMLVLIVAVGFAFLKIYIGSFPGSMPALAAEKAQAQAELDKWNKENAEIQQEVTDSQTDDWVKQQARERLGMVMPGEIKIAEEDK